MRLLLWLCLAAVAAAIMVPVETGSQRCLVIYSMSHEDTIKIGLKFPSDPRVQQIYDYSLKVRDLTGGVVLHERISAQNWRTQVSVPNQTIYEACIGVLLNQTRASNTSVRFRGEVLVSYEANTHFVAEGSRVPAQVEGIREEEVMAMKSQVNDLINITKQFVQLQRIQRQEETREYEEKKHAEESIFEWWMLELVLIAALGLVQWNRMKHKIQGDKNSL